MAPRFRRPRRLITIPISHFCEKARWALERAGLSYVEEPHVQVIHWVAVRRAGGDSTAPVLVCDEGVFADSTAILEYCDAASSTPERLYPTDPQLGAEVRGLEDHFDEGLGPEGRRWMYHHVLSQHEILRHYGVTGVPRWERRLLPLTLGVIGPVIRRHLDVDAETAAYSDHRVGEIFDEVAERLADGRRFLVGDRFTAADLSFAALSAAVVVPEGYGVPLPPAEALPEPMESRVRELRRHPAGEYALRLYREERDAGRAERAAEHSAVVAEWR